MPMLSLYKVQEISISKEIYKVAPSGEKR